MSTDYTSSPAPVDAFSRFFSRTFDESKIVGVPTLFQSLFGRPGSETLFTSDAATVDIDIVRNEGERLARLIERGINSRVISGLGKKSLGTTKFNAESRKWTLVEEEGDLSADQLLYRDPSERPGDRMTRQQRMRNRAQRINVESVRRIVRLFEFLSAQSTITGKMPAILGTTDANMIYDFLRNPTHIFDASSLWSNSATDIPADFDLAWKLIRVDAHMNADYALVGATAMNNIMGNTIVKDRADNRRFRVITIGGELQVPAKFAHLLAAGATARGLLETPVGHQFWLFTYDDYYTDDAGDPQPYLPVDKCVIGVSNARADRYFGPPERLPIMPSDVREYTEVFGFNPNALPQGVNVKNAGAVLDPAWFYFDFYPFGNKKGLTLRVQTAPIFATTQTDAWVTINTQGSP
jgi:hypothetical protein